MKKEQRSSLIEFVNSISDDELKYIGVRLVERLTGDLADVLHHLERRPGPHAVISEANDAQEVFAILNLVQEVVSREAKRRGILLSMRPLLSAATAE